jgi:hypothetical protein
MSDKLKIILLLSTLILSVGYRYYEVKNTKQNYLYMGSLGLSKHLIAKSDPSEKKVIILGNSPVSGNNIPRNTTTTDYLNLLEGDKTFYNLASMEQSIVESMVYMNQAAVYKPELVLVGINARTFPNHIGGKELFQYNDEFLKESLNKLEYEKLEKEINLKRNVFSFITKAFSGKTPSSFQLEFQTFFNKLRTQFYGDLYNRSIYGKLSDSIDHLQKSDSSALIYLESFIKLANKLNIRPIFYFVPIHDLEKIYPIEEYRKYKKLITDFVISKKVLIFDYDNALSSNHHNYIDFIHRTAKGNREMAKLLKRDLVENDLF